MAEKISPPKENLEKPQTAIGIAFADAEEVKKQKEVAEGEALGNEVWNTLSDPNLLQNIASEKEKIAGTKIKEPLIQVETKPGLAWTEPKEDPPQGRERAPMTPPDTRPLIQVETKIPIPEEISLKSEIPTLTDVVSEEEFGRMRTGTETPIIPNPEDAIDQEHMREIFNTEGTPKEWKDKLRGLIDGAKEKLGVGERVERMKGYTASRSEELNTEAKGYGAKIENFIRASGEGYNKLSLKKKILIGGVLGVGAAAFSTVSTPLATAFAINIGLQRAAGMAGMFLKIEKHLQDTGEGKTAGYFAAREWYKKIAEKPERQRQLAAAIMSVGYTAGVSGLIGGGVHLASESSAGQAVHEWLRNVLGHHTATPESSVLKREMAGKITSAPAGEAPHAVAAPTPEGVQPAAAAAAGGEVAATAIAPEIPGIEVKATPGHGYEFMMKRLWEQLQEKHVGLPANANPDSDLAKLLAADKDSINTVVHNLAKDNEWFKENGMSASIGENAKMTIGTDGNIWVTSDILAPENAHLTPAYHPDGPLTPISPMEVEPPPVVHEVNLISAQDTVMPSPTEHALPPVREEGSLVDSSGNAVLDSQGSPVHTGLNEAPASPAAPASEAIISNKFGLSIPTAEPHIYANEAKSMFAYGGTAEERMKMITDYLSKNPNKVIYAEDVNGHRVPWLRDLGGKGEIVQGPPLRTSGFSSLFSSFLKAPSPDDLREVIK